ncbi:MAG: hypothetical protein U9R66_10210 [Thermodesulfobacteriota bacterium]|nr:hypothetical protein [Thermodesulfobacteriota bacterium]
MLKKVIVLLAVLSLFVGSVGTVLAADEWFSSCTIERLGAVEDQRVLIKLNHNDFDGGDNWFEITDTVGVDRGLAVLLTAMSLDKVVKIYAEEPDGNASTYEEIKVIYIDQ